jgi:hypothetical protein
MSPVSSVRSFALSESRTPSSRRGEQGGEDEEMLASASAKGVMGVVRSTASSQKVEMAGASAFEDAFYNNVLALLPSSAWRPWGHVYHSFCWITLAFWIVTIFFQLDFKPWWYKVEHGALCRFVEVVEQVVIKVLLGAANLLCFYAGREGYAALLSVPRVQDVIRGDEDKWRRTTRRYLVHTISFSLWSLVFFTAAWSKGWAQYHSGTHVPNNMGGVASIGLVKADATVLQPILYGFLAPIQNLINQSTTWAFVAVHALLVCFVELHYQRASRLARSSGDASLLLDAYHEAGEQQRLVMAKYDRRTRLPPTSSGGGPPACPPARPPARPP